MIKSAKSIIGCLFNNVEDSMESRDDIRGLQKITMVKEKVNRAMEEHHDISKWDLYKETEEYEKIKLDFEGILVDAYPEIKSAYLIFQNPCLIRKSS